MVETERKYVQDLEVMQVRFVPFLCEFVFLIRFQKYSYALSQSNAIDQDTIHYLFPNLNKLLNFQRKFLIRLESTAELPWQDQRWGHHFIESVSPSLSFWHSHCGVITEPLTLLLFGNNRKKSLLFTNLTVPIIPTPQNSCYPMNKTSW